MNGSKISRRKHIFVGLLHNCSRGEVAPDNALPGKLTPMTSPSDSDGLAHGINADDHDFIHSAASANLDTRLWFKRKCILADLVRFRLFLALHVHRVVLAAQNFDDWLLDTLDHSLRR